MRASGAALACAICAAVAGWFSLGAVAVTSTGPDVTRVGLLPPFWVLGVLLGVAVAATLWRRPSPGRAWPLLASVLLILPWLPGRIPAAFLVWTGRIAAAVWTAVVVGVLVAREREILPAAWRRRLTSPRRAPWIAALVASVLYLAAARHMIVLLPGGDEPHYLVITQSLLTDGDLQIENNHRRHDYKAYFPGELRPDYLRRGQNGEIYSIHAPGLPTLIAPAFALFGYPGVVGFLALVSGVTTALAWRLAFLVTGSAGAAWFGWAAVALSVPFFFQAFAVFPDGPASAFLLVGVWGLLGAHRNAARPGLVRVFLAGAALAVLPWLHTRYVVLAGATALCILLRLATSPGRLARSAAFLAVPLFSATAWFAFFHAIYGTVEPWAPYAGYSQSRLAHVPVGLPGLLVDQQFGLIANAPVYVVAFVGLVLMAVRPPRAATLADDGALRHGNAGEAPGATDALLNPGRLALALAVIILPYLVAVAAYRMWWFGWSAPARVLVPVLPALAIPVAVAWTQARSQTSRAMAALALGTSLLITATLAGVENGALVHNERDGYALWLDWVARVSDVPQGLPSLFRDPSETAVLFTLVWTAALAGAWSVARALEGRLVRSRGGVVLAATLALAMAVMGALSTVWHLRGERGLSAMFSQVDLLERFAPGLRPLGVEGRSWRLSDPTQLIQRLEIGYSERAARRRARNGRPLLFLGRVPAGTYRVRVHGSDPHGVLDVSLGGTELRAATVKLDELPRDDPSFELRLPVEVLSIAVHGDEAASRTVGRPSVSPVSIVPRRLRMGDRYARRAARYGDSVVYFLYNGAYAELHGFWVAPRAAADVLIVPDAHPGAHTVRVVLRNAPVRNRVTLESIKWRQVLDLAPGQEQAVDIPVDPSRGLVSLRILATTGFRPADLQPGNPDDRELALRVEVR